MQGLVTVFGGTGFVGAQVVRALAKGGARIRVAVRNPGRGYRLRMLGDVGQIQIVQANIRNQASIDRALDGAEACINLAGVLYSSARQTFHAVHVDGAGAVARAARARGIGRYVHMSALGADPASPSEYARTKAQGEQAVRDILPGAVIIRPSIVFGAEDDFFNRFGALASVSPVLPLVGGGETRFQPVYVADVAAAIARAATDPNCAGQTYELGGPGVHSFKSLMEMVNAVTYRRRTLVTVPWQAAGLIGMAGDLQAWIKGGIGLVPAPILTRDQVALLKADNVVSEGAAGLAALGVAATAMEPVLPTYMYRYRKGGQFAPAPARA
jgi:NADH dehydrogenase